MPHNTTPYHAIKNPTATCHAMPCHTILYHTTLCHTIPCYTILYHATPYRAIPFHTIPCHTIPPYHTVPCHTVQHHTILCHAMPFHTTLYLPTRDPKPLTQRSLLLLGEGVWHPGHDEIRRAEKTGGRNSIGNETIKSYVYQNIFELACCIPQLAAVRSLILSPPPTGNVRGHYVRSVLPEKPEHSRVALHEVGRARPRLAAVCPRARPVPRAVFERWGDQRHEWEVSKANKQTNKQTGCFYWTAGHLSHFRLVWAACRY